MRAAVGAFLRNYRPGEGPFAISEAIHAVRRTYPVMELSDSDLTAAIARQAIAAGLNIHFDGAGRTAQAIADTLAMGKMRAE